MKRSGDYWVLVPIGPGKVVVVNAIGHKVFTLCDGTWSSGDIAHDLADASRREVEIVHRDVNAYLEQLAAAGLLTD